MRKALALTFSWLLLSVAAFAAEKPVPVVLTAGQSNADGRVPIAQLPKFARYNYCQWSYGSGDFTKATGTFKRDKHLSDRSYQDILMKRALATVKRDKLHPSVLVWSVGNENPLTQPCIEVGNYVGALDPSRPYCFPQVGSYFRRFWEKGTAEQGVSPFPSAAPVYAPHYPTTGQIGGFYQQFDRPVIFTEYCHTLGISFEDHDRQWEVIERTPGIAGGAQGCLEGSVWLRGTCLHFTRWRF